MKIRGIDYYVEDLSNEKDEPLVLLHGFTGSSQNWKPILDQLSHTRAILIDIIGHGKSEIPLQASRYKMDEAVEDLAAILDELKINKTNILGYSMGGRLALSFAATYPNRVNKLILESSSPGLKLEEEREKRKRADEMLADEIIKMGINHFVDKWENITLFYSQKRLPLVQQISIRQQRLQNSSIGLANSLIGMGTGAQPPRWDYLSNMHIPVLIICGQLDKKFCDIANRMHHLLPKSVVKVINGAGHAIHVEEPRIFGKIVNEFLNLDYK